MKSAGDRPGRPADRHQRRLRQLRRVEAHQQYVDYHGNGTYTLTQSRTTRTPAAARCPTPTSYTWTVRPKRVGRPARPDDGHAPGRTPSRRSRSSSTHGNPGRDGLRDQVRQGRGRSIPDGSLNSPALKDGLLQLDDGQGGADRRARARRPTQIVARARNGSNYTPWSAPGHVQPDRAVRPFVAHVPRPARPELPGSRPSSASPPPPAAASRSRWPRARRARASARSARPRSTARASSSCASASRVGTYRMRYSFKGTSTVARGSVTEVVTIKRVLG